MTQFVPECLALMNRWVFALTHNAFNLSDREEPSFNTVTMSACADSLYSKHSMDVPHAINTNKGQEMIPFNILNSDSFWTPAI